MPRITILILILFLSQSFGLEDMRCGTLRFMEALKNPQKRIFAKSGCIQDNSKADIYSKKTANFIIYYTKTGPHAIRYNEYIDSLASYLEQAYNLHKNTIGMKGISGARKTYYYNQNVPDGLYPIEVVDTEFLLEPPPFGITYSMQKGTEIIIENDFSYYDANCLKQPFRSQSTGKNYYIEWDLALRVTIFHELYHAFQSAYFNWQRYSTFWMEASATGVEEIGAPDVNDYINYLSSNFKNPGKSMESIESGSLEEYAWASLYLFLHSKIDPRFDSAIWDYFSKYPRDNFGIQFARLVDSLQRKHGFDKDAEDLFHEYAKQVFYSGSRTEFSPYELFWNDMPKWPNWKVNTESPLILQPGTIDFIRTANEPNTVSVARKSPLQDGNSQVWALSRLLVASDTAAKEIAAYPNPWNPKTPAIHFKNLPEKSKGVEIRSANGALIARVDSLWEPKKFPAPGILYYRSLPYGKNKVLIVQY